MFVKPLLLIAVLGAPLQLNPADAPVSPFMSGGTLYTKGEIAFFVAVPSEAELQVEVEAAGTNVENAWPLFAITVDQAEAARHEALSAEAAKYGTELSLPAGVHRIGVRLLNEAGGFFSRRELALKSVRISPTDNPDLELRASDEATWLKEGARREQQTILHAREVTKTSRMHEATVKFVDAKGAPLANTEVDIELTRHAFLFGGLVAGMSQYPSATANEEYRTRFRDIFNYATVPFYWRAFEQKKGTPNHAEKEEMLNWCLKNDILVKGHPLLWGHEASIPEWAGGQPSAEVQEAFVRDTMKRYAGKVAYWEVVNEPVNQPSVKLMPAHKWAHEADPSAKLVINEYGIFYESYPEFYTMMQESVATKVPFDAIGIQAHAPTDMAFPVDRVWRILDWYAQLGKPIHITEFTPPSKGAKLTGATWRGVWSEEVQAKYAEDFYRVCFAHPAVEAITWWDFADTGAWVPGGGMLRSDRTPKPVYERLRKLIREEWTTKLTVNTNEDGSALVTAYKGDYIAQTHDKAASFSLDDENEVLVKLK